MASGGQFERALAALAEAYGASLTAERIVIYRDAMADLPDEAWRQAMACAVRECRFFPSVAELRAMVGGSPEDRGVLAWNGLLAAAGEVGAYASLELEDAAAADALQQVFGSWPEFCAQEEGPQLAQRRQEFLAAYRQARRTPPLQAPGIRTARRLMGLCEADGNYRQTRVVWVGQLSAGGTVRTLREQRMAELPAGNA